MHHGGDTLRPERGNAAVCEHEHSETICSLSSGEGDQSPLGVAEDQDSECHGGLHDDGDALGSDAKSVAQLVLGADVQGLGEELKRSRDSVYGDAEAEVRLGGGGRVGAREVDEGDEGGGGDAEQGGESGDVGNETRCGFCLGGAEEGIADALVGEKEDGREQEVELDGGGAEDLGRDIADKGLVENEGEDAREDLEKDEGRCGGEGVVEQVCAHRAPWSVPRYCSL